MKKIMLIIVFIIGIMISVVISTYTYIKVRPDKKVIYKETKELKSTSDPDYINGVYSSAYTIKSNITSLTTKTADSGWLTTTISNASFSGTIYYRKVGSLVLVYCPSTYMVNLPTTYRTQITTMPSGYRPIMVELVKGNAYESLADVAFKIDTDGKVYVHPSYASGYYGFTTTYFVD